MAAGEKTLGWRVLAGLLIPFLLLVGRYRIVGSARIPKTGAMILAPNHVTNFDPLVTAYVVWRAGRVPRFLAKASLFKVPVFGAILRATGQIPVDRGGLRKGDSLDRAAQLAADGRALIVYPEGTLTRDPGLWPMRAKTGAVRLALENGIPIIPIAHWGAQRILPHYSKRLSLFPRKNVDVLIGEPVDLGRFRDRPLTAADYAEAAEVVMQAITSQLQQLRDEQPPAKRWNPAEHGQSEFGRPA